MAVSVFTFAFILSILSISAVDAAHHHATAPSPSSSSSSTPAVDCSTLILNMADCLTFVTSGSEVSKPEGSCCSGLKTVLKTGPECLCEAFKNSASMGVTLNVTKAAALPAACKVSAPSATNCAVSVAPAGAPDVQPSAAAESANEVAPAPAPGSSGSSVLLVSAGSLVVGIISTLVSGYVLC